MINKHKSNKIKENSNTVRHLNNGTDHRHSKSCCDQSSPARRTMMVIGDRKQPTKYWPWWRHQIEAFSALLVFCAVNSPVTGEFPAQRPVTRGFDVFFDLHLNQQLSKQWRRRWFESPSRSLRRHCNAKIHIVAGGIVAAPSHKWRRYCHGFSEYSGFLVIGG